MNKLIAIRRGDRYRRSSGDILEVILTNKNLIALVFEDGGSIVYPRRDMVEAIRDGWFTKIEGDNG